MMEFKNDIAENVHVISQSNNMKDKIENYNVIMKEIVDKHAPIVTKQIKVVKKAPWFDAEYALLRRQRRKAERKFKRTGLQNDKNVYIDLRKQTTALALEKKKSFITKKNYVTLPSRNFKRTHSYNK